jgi:hypothetical protein
MADAPKTNGTITDVTRMGKNFVTSKNKKNY